eukprot:Nitzschia sp. Nitz4//scaffold204_size40132//7208//7738//NITZ4_007539-RA/size40132-processed-gene-0.12-mRNA-1//1//CDS//3329541464//696//frame0
MATAPYPRGAVAVTMQSWCPTHETNYYLLVQRANKPDAGKWSIPGGKVEWGESAFQAAQRELTEETNLLAQDCQWYPDPFTLTDAIIRNPNNENDVSFHYMIAQYFGKTSLGLPEVTPQDDALDARWWTLAQMQEEMLPQGLLRPDVVKVIQRAEELSTHGMLPLLDVGHHYGRAS